jgi:uncharacterized protein (UPF0333 family)
MKRLRSFFTEARGQASVEYILVTMILVAASYGAVRLFMFAWKACFNAIAARRATPLP